jgi:hypothetical protein
MDINAIIDAARTRAGDVDPAAYRYTTNEYALIVADSVRSFGVRGDTAGIGSLVVVTTAGSEAIAPEASDLQGLLLATATVVRLLQRTYRKRLDEGSIGVSWTSGLEAESTISAEKAYEAMIQDIQNELAELIIFANAKTFASRPQ